jgi:hypothetical protein
MLDKFSALVLLCLNEPIQTMSHNHHEKPEPKHILEIEGKEHGWHKDTITIIEIAQLGGWDHAHGVIEIDHDNVERILVIEEIVTLRPGSSFGKKHRWKRG